MRAIFVDCTPEFRSLIDACTLIVPRGVTVNDGSPAAYELETLCSGFDVIFTEHTVIPSSIFDACPTIKAVVFMGTGAGTYVDMADAKRRGIKVATVPGYGDRAVAEHALALMFCAARNIAAMDRDIRAGIWMPTGGKQLLGARLAVVGMGGIGTCLVELATSIGMKVAAWNRSPRAHAAFNPDLNSVLEQADFVSMHLSLSDETRGIIDARRLSLPKTGFIFVNTARAELVDEAALLDELRSGRIGHAALDVFPTEPMPADNPYKMLPNVTLTAHAAYMTNAAYIELWVRTLKAFDGLKAA